MFLRPPAGINATTTVATRRPEQSCVHGGAVPVVALQAAVGSEIGVRGHLT